jgi:DNA end-binding protein Ku
MRALWSGSIGFGLVNIPLKFNSATQDSRRDQYMPDVF